MRVSVLCTYDCSNDPLRAGPFDDAAAQLVAARTIILTKPDRVDAAGVARVRAEVAAINPLAVILDESDPQRRAVRAFTAVPGGEGAANPDPAPSVGHSRISVVLASLPRVPDWADLSDWLENLAGACGDRLLRVKGFVRVTDCPDPLLLQGVGGSFDVPRRMPGLAAAENAMVIILRDTGLAELEAVTPALGLRFSTERQKVLACT